MSKVKAHPYLENVEPYLPGDFAVEGVSEIIKLSSNESLMGPSPLVAKALDEIKDTLHTYPDSNSTELREAIARQYGLDPERIVCEAGSEPLINLLARAYASPGDEILYSQYAFIAYKLAAEAVGATPVAAVETNYTADVDALLARVNSKTRIVYVANPNNPTGTRISFAEVKRLRSQLPEHILLVLDGAYAEFNAPPEERTQVTGDEYRDGCELVNDESGNVVVLHTFSKIYGLAALRLGWAYAPQDIARILNQLRGVFTVSRVAQVAGVAALSDTRHTRIVIEHTVKWREWMADALSNLALTVLPSHANFLCVKFPDEQSAQAADLALRREGLIPRTLREYGMPDCLRITIGLEAHCRKVIDVLGRMR